MIAGAGSTALGRAGTLTHRDKQTGKRLDRRAKFKSLGKVFMKSIQELVAQIDSTQVHFVRTLKTNKPMRPGYFQPDYVIPQLQDQGLLALCDLLKAGFPSRIEYGELVERFSPKMPTEINVLGLDNKDYVNAIVWAYGLPKSNYQCGKTKIFFRAGKVAILDQLDKITPEEHATLVKCAPAGPWPPPPPPPPLPSPPDSFMFALLTASASVSVSLFISVSPPVSGVSASLCLSVCWPVSLPVCRTLTLFCLFSIHHKATVSL